MSTITQGMLFNWCFIHPGTSALVIAHESEASQSIYEKAQLFWETWPFKHLYTTRHLSQKRLTWNETGSSLRIATARNVQTGRGRTIHALHASECAFWENAETLMTGLSQTIPEKHGSIIVLESTANGIGNWFYDQWEAAVNRDSDYIPLFFPWFKHPEYQSVNPTLKLLDLNSEERDYYKLGCDLPHLEWRRWMIPNKLQNDADMFRQEYPATPEEAFLTTGTNVFSLDRLGDCYEPLPTSGRGKIETLGTRSRFVPDRNGPVTIFKWPSKDRSYGQYFVGGDPSYTTEGDRACIQVINRRTFEQVAVWHGKIDAVHFADEIVSLAMYYNNATVTAEIEGPGQATIAAIIKSGYPHIWQHRWADKAPGKLSNSLGWSTNFQRKHWMMGYLKAAVSDQSIVIHDPVTYNQFRNYVVKPNGEMGNNSNVAYDDAVMAFGITFICIVTEGPVGNRETGAEPTRLHPGDGMDSALGGW